MKLQPWLASHARKGANVLEPLPISSAWELGAGTKDDSLGLSGVACRDGVFRGLAPLRPCILLSAAACPGDFGEERPS